MVPRQSKVGHAALIISADQNGMPCLHYRFHLRRLRIIRMMADLSHSLSPRLSRRLQKTFGVLPLVRVFRPARAAAADAN